MKSFDQWHLPTRRLGRRTIVFDRLDSTNTYAASQADDLANDGLVVVAREQTAGRGQYSRTWQAPAGTSVLLSVLLFPPSPLRRPALLTAWAAVSVCETIQHLTCLHAKIKWPNDVLINDRKVCGILIEQARGTVAGIGLNLNQTAEHFAAAGLEQASSLSLCAGRNYDADDAGRLLIHQLDQAYDGLHQGDVSSLAARWRDRLGLQHQIVIAECVDGKWLGRLIDVRLDAVLLETANGPVRLLPETVRQLRPA